MGEPGALLRTVGVRIRVARDAAGLTQQQVADSIGMVRSSVANLEAGRQDMNITRLSMVAAVLKLDLTDLIRPGDLPPPPHEVTIQAVFEVYCETCSMVIDAPASREVAAQSRRDHIAAMRKTEDDG